MVNPNTYTPFTGMRHTHSVFISSFTAISLLSMQSCETSLNSICYLCENSQLPGRKETPWQNGQEHCPHHVFTTPESWTHLQGICTSIAGNEKENDKTIQEQLRQDYDSLNDFIQMITTNQSRIFDFQMHIVLTADSKEELDQKKLQIKNFLTAMELRAIPLRFEQRQVLKSIIPIFPKQQIEEQIGTPITTPTIAAITITGIYHICINLLQKSTNHKVISGRV